MKRKYSPEEVAQHMSGRFYINPDDRNIFVRRNGLGAWTMNLGNKWSWAVIAAELFVIALIVLFVL